MAILTDLSNRYLALEIFKECGLASSKSTLTNFKQNLEFHLLVSWLQDRDSSFVKFGLLQGDILTHDFKVNLTQTIGQ